MRILLAPAVGLLGLVAVGCAPLPNTAGAAPRQCFFVSQVSGFEAETERTVYVTAGVNDVYQLDMAGPCPNVDWSQRIGIVPRGGGSSVCAGYDAELLVPQGAGAPYRCQVRAVRRLSDAEAAARR